VSCYGRPVRPELEKVLTVLLGRAERDLDLDVIGDAIGTTPVSTEDVEALFAALEAHGRGVAELSSEAVGVALRRVLTVARALRLETGVVPTPTEIAARADLTVETVRGALLFARVIQRPG
jgi:hypothetical protein